MGAILNFVGYFIIGLPIVYYNVFYRKTDLRGIWEGAVICVLFVSICYLWVSLSINWEQRIEEMSKRREMDLINMKAQEE